ncbi:penicillin-binding protein 2 [Deinococcus psychrotolerans]|uniref:Penicillin-binding protein 2 n=2 Tax=Deinococcus TaxID=1298 RepID=A0A553UWB0_9DEIO|nr:MULTISPECIES: penicillin-binding protein 2 [Deinococcus]AZI41909.1 penicillin-binding protein 2 [Deinococcus psychrotolerans]TSA84494.1 penicillin-binding protein 2 [Deinococcus detaillensis]
MEIKIRNRSRIIQAIALLAFMSLVWAYAQLEWGLPQNIKRAVLQSRGSILTESGTTLARTVDGKRVYPQGKLAGQVLGMMGMTDGLEGIEAAYNTQLSAGQNVTVTLDPSLQATAESVLAKGVQAHQGVYGSVVVIEVRTGKVLVAASYPPFDPNNWKTFSAEARRNRPFLDRFEPGSTVKGLTVAAALNEGLTTADTTYQTPMQRFVGGRWGSIIHDAVDHPKTLTTQGILRYSSNVGMSHIVENFPNEKLYAYLHAFGFGQDVDLPTMITATGSLQPVSKWNDLVRITNAFGQGMSSTPLQLAAAYNTLANDGRYVSPRLVASEPAGESRNVVRVNSAQTTRTLLRNVIRDGIHAAAGIQGYDLAGKTGTAQVVVDGKYSATIYDSVFAGFYPADEPRITIAVMVHGAKYDYHGSMLAAPIYRDITAAFISKAASLPAPEPEVSTGK